MKLIRRCGRESGRTSRVSGPYTYIGGSWPTRAGIFGGSLRSNCAARSGQTLDPHRLRPPKQSNQIPKKSPDGLTHITNTPRVLALRVRRLFSCERDPLSVLFLQQAHRISSFSPLTSVFFFITSFCWFCV